jgi:hypothetical protein
MGARCDGHHEKSDLGICGRFVDIERVQGSRSGSIAQIVMAITAARAVCAYTHGTFTNPNGAAAVPTTNDIDSERTEAERRDELLDRELDTVTGGLTGFQWGVGRGIGSAMSGQ